MGRQAPAEAPEHMHYQRLNEALEVLLREAVVGGWGERVEGGVGGWGWGVGVAWGGVGVGGWGGGGGVWIGLCW